MPNTICMAKCYVNAKLVNPEMTMRTQKRKVATVTPLFRKRILLAHTHSGENAAEMLSEFGVDQTHVSRWQSSCQQCTSLCDWQKGTAVDMCVQVTFAVCTAADGSVSTCCTANPRCCKWGNSGGQQAQQRLFCQRHSSDLQGCTAFVNAWQLHIP